MRVPGGLLGTEWLMGEWACDEIAYLDESYCLSLPFF